MLLMNAIGGNSFSNQKTVKNSNNDPRFATAYLRDDALAQKFLGSKVEARSR
jgi:hypothetical protein